MQRNFHFPGRSAVLTDNGMCATSHPLAASAAIEILKSGGNAVDAAIAGAVLLGICEPQMTGIGGDCFALIALPGADSIRALNGSGRAPAGQTADALRAEGHKTMPTYDARAVTIPTAVDAFCKLNAAHGKLGLDQVLAPAIHYAETGVPVAPRVAADWPEAAQCLQGTARDYYLRGGKPYHIGQRFSAPKQAEVLRRIARDGRDAFYTGEIAEDMVQSLRAAGGAHQLGDFAAAEATDATPIESSYGGLTLVEHPPNGQGATAMLMLNILSHFDIAGLDPLGATRAHLEAEAAKLAYDMRNRIIADPEQTAHLDAMLSMDVAKSLAGRIRMDAVLTDIRKTTEAVHKDTIYITVVDRDRMAVSLIYSIFHGFGSGIASDKFGILFQNRGAGFSLEPGHPNELGPRKRPMHTIIPGMLKDKGKIMMPFGVMGGAYQPNGHARFVSNLTDYGMDPQSAIDAPRSFADGDVLRLEEGYAPEVRQALADLGHKVEVPTLPIGGAQAIRIRDDGVLAGASDPRKDGCALGY